MAKKRELSPLQKAYADFFFAKLEEYEVTSPAKLSKEKKKEFFNSIKKEWPAAKRKVKQEGRLTAQDKKLVVEDEMFRRAVRSLLKELSLPKSAMDKYAPKANKEKESISFPNDGDTKKAIAQLKKKNIDAKVVYGKTLKFINTAEFKKAKSILKI